MDAILISFSICLLGVMVTVLLFAVAMRPEDEAESTAPKKHPSEEGNFFLDEGPGFGSEPEAPTNALLLELERHIQVENEAAKTFLRGPSVDTLQAGTERSFWH